MSSSEIVTKLELDFQSGVPFTMPAMSWQQFIEVLIIMKLGK